MNNRHIAALSAGALDQLYLAVRLAICELVLPPEKHVPLILDDVFASFDDQRLAAALEWLDLSGGSSRRPHSYPERRYCMFPLNTFENLCVFFLLLMIYSAAGWVGEMFYCSVGKGHICEKRGFLNGFICPIYGHGALLVLYVLHGGLKNPLLTFLAGMALTSALEYFTSWFMEAVFHMRWWDYSRKKIQLNGRICLQNSLLFGLACVLLCHVVNPPVMAWLFHIGSAYTIPVASFLFGLYLMDNVLSVRSAIQLSHRLDDLQKVRQEIRSHLEEKAAQLQQKYEGRLEEVTDRFMAGLEDANDDFLKEKKLYLAQLRSGEDLFERRLLRSHPDLRSKRHSRKLLNLLREKRPDQKDKK